MSYEVVTLDVDNSEMETFCFKPNGDGPHPGLILAQHIPVGHTGIENDEFTLVTAQRFADAGYYVLAPFIFHWWPKDGEMMDKAKASRDDWTIKDIKTAYQYLVQQPDVDDQAVGVCGHCWGGRVAWLSAGHIEGIKACAVFYGGRIKLALGEANPPAIDLAPNFQCEVAGFFGNDDKNPTPEDVDDYEAALKAAGVTYEFHRYDGAGHAFQNFPTEDRYRETQSEDAWGKVLDFFERTLKA